MRASQVATVGFAAAEPAIGLRRVACVRSQAPPTARRRAARTSTATAAGWFRYQAHSAHVNVHFCPADRVESPLG
jgi:hypothetical protein